MQFEKVLSQVASFLEGRGFRVGVVGALGLHAYGLTRATADLDLVVERKAQPALLGLLDSLGYERLNVSDGYSNHLHALPSLGRLDLIYVDGSTADTLFAEARQVQLFPGLDAWVPRSEHLAAMKVPAMKNDPARTLQEMADIQFLLGLENVDEGAIRAQLERHGLIERFHEIKQAIARARP